MKESDRIAMLIETAIAEIEEHIKENTRRDNQLKTLFGDLIDLRSIRDKEKLSEVKG